MTLEEKDRLAVTEIYKLVTSWSVDQTIEEMMDTLSEIQGVLEYNHEWEELK